MPLTAVDPVAACAADDSWRSRLPILSQAIAGASPEALAGLLAEAELPPPRRGYVENRAAVHVATATDAALAVTIGGARLDLLPGVDFVLLDPEQGVPTNREVTGPVVLGSDTAELHGAVALYAAPAGRCQGAGGECAALLDAAVQAAQQAGAVGVLFADAPPPPRLHGPDDVDPAPWQPPPPLAPRLALGWSALPDAPSSTVPVALISSRATDLLFGGQAACAGLYQGAAALPARPGAQIDIGARYDRAPAEVAVVSTLIPGGGAMGPEVTLAGSLDDPQEAAAAIEAARLVARCAIARRRPVRLVMARDLAGPSAPLRGALRGARPDVLALAVLRAALAPAGPAH